MISWNPIYTGSWHKNTKPTFGVRIECVSGECVGLPCEIDPTKNGIGGVTSNQVGSGADNVKFCVVNVSSGGKANIVTFPVGGSDSDDDSGLSAAAVNSQGAAGTTKSPESPTTSTTTSTSPASDSKSKGKPSTTSLVEETSTSSSADESTTTAFRPQILFESEGKFVNSTTLAAPTKSSNVTSATKDAVTSPTDKKSNANAVSGSMFGLAVVFAAAVCIL